MSPTWLKENLFIVAALALPLVVIAFFLAATSIPRLLVDDPAYDLYFALQDYDAPASGYSLRFRVADGRLYADTGAHSAYYPSPTQRLFRFDASTGSVRHVAVEIPAEIQQQVQEELDSWQRTDRAAQYPAPPVGVTVQTGFPVVPFVVPETEGLTLHGETVAPDGYAFKGCCSGSRGLFGELFGMGSRRADLRITKSGRVIELENPDPDSRHYYNSRSSFLGWAER